MLHSSVLAVSSALNKSSSQGCSLPNPSFPHTILRSFQLCSAEAGPFSGTGSRPLGCRIPPPASPSRTSSSALIFHEYDCVYLSGRPWGLTLSSGGQSSPSTKGLLSSPLRLHCPGDCLIHCHTGQPRQNREDSTART
jgi:hypothetical protein